MSTEPSTPEGKDVQMPSRFMHRFDIWGIWGLYAMLVAATILSTLGITDGYDTLFWISVATQVPYAALILVAARRHTPGLCGICFDEFPLDPGSHAAGKARPQLIAFHFIYDSLVIYWHWLQQLLRNQIVAVIAYNLSLGVVVLGLGLLIGQWAIVVIIGGFLLIGLIVQQHRRLQLWCPVCRRGRGGDDDDDPEPGPPDPDPTGATITEEIAVKSNSGQVTAVGSQN